MSATKNLRTIIAAGTSNSAGGTTTGTVVDLRTAYGGLLTAKITNGGTGPSAPAAVKVYTSGDNSNFKLLCTLTGDTASASVNEWPVEIPPGVMYLRADVTGNTGQAVTCEAFLQELTAV